MCRTRNVNVKFVTYKNFNMSVNHNVLNAMQQFAEGDRFIPRRKNLELVSHIVMSNPIREHDYVEFEKQLKRRRYLGLLESTLLGSSRKSNILSFGSDTNEEKIVLSKEPAWPCKPRKSNEFIKRLITLDVPDLTNQKHHNLIDWNMRDAIITLCNNKICIWNPATDQRVQSEQNFALGKCIKWNYAGTIFAVTLPPGFAYGDRATKLSNAHNCYCITSCLVVTLSWSRENLFVGCTNGHVSIFKEYGILIDFYQIFKHAVIDIKFSSSERFVSLVSENKILKVFYRSNMESNANIFIIKNVEDHSWHPWKESILAVGRQKRIEIWNMNSLKDPQIFTNFLEIDSISFSPVSAELAVASYVYEENRTIVKVYKDCAELVDITNCNRGRVRYLLWGSRGKILATGGSDETLIVWQFLKANQRKKYFRCSDSLVDLYGRTTIR